MRRKFNKNMYEYLYKNGYKHTIDEWVNIINKKYNETYNKESLQKYFYRNNISYKYKDFNKSKNNVYSLPIGSERIRKDGMIQIKVSNRKWMYKQRFIYESYYKINLDKDTFVIFLDGNRNNFDIKNLKAISKKESSYMANNMLFCKNKDLTLCGNQIAKLMIKTNDIKKGKRYEN